MSDYFALRRNKRMTHLTPSSKFDEELMTPYFRKSLSNKFIPEDLRLEERINEYLNSLGVYLVTDDDLNNIGSLNTSPI